MKQKYIVRFGLILLFILGIFLGYHWNSHGISSIQGYLFKAVGTVAGINATNSNATNSNATNSNATNSNATHSNATNSNATNSNATASNATHSNATHSNATHSNAATASNATNANVPSPLYLDRFSLNESRAKGGDRVGVTLSTGGATPTGGNVTFREKSKGIVFSAMISSIQSSPYIIIPKTVDSGDYEVVSVFLVSQVSQDGQFFTDKFTTNGVGKLKFAFNSSIVIVASNTNDFELLSFSMKSQTVRAGTDVPISYTSTKKLDSLSLYFAASEGNASFTAYVRFLDDGPYFVVPSDVVKGTYLLEKAVLVSGDSSRTYSAGAFNFGDTNLVVQSGQNADSYYYNNEEVLEDVITRIAAVPKGSTIVINADKSPVIDSDVFTAIQGKDIDLIIQYGDHQMKFNGEEITNAKSIDTSLDFYSVSEDDDISQLIDDAAGVVIEFADNGVLPGEATVRIRENAVLSKEFAGKAVYVYAYNDGEGTFCEVSKTKVKLKDGYYEFKIHHTSRYVMTMDEIDDSLVVEDDSIVSFEKDLRIYLLLLAIALVVIILVGVIVFIQKKNQKNDSNKKSLEKDKEEAMEEKESSVMEEISEESEKSVSEESVDEVEESQEKLEKKEKNSSKEIQKKEKIKKKKEK